MAGDFALREPDGSIILLGRGTTVINNKIAGELVVKGNTGTVVDTPNEVEGKSKIQ